MTTTITELDDFKALAPFFRIIEKGLEGIADGGHFFDLLAEAVIFDYIITTPGYPRRVEGRKAIAELYRPYGTMIVLDRCHDLAVHHDIKTGVVVLEYASEGRVVSTGAPYTNRYISVLTITDRKVTNWRTTSTRGGLPPRSDGRHVDGRRIFGSCRPPSGKRRGSVTRWRPGKSGDLAICGSWPPTVPGFQLSRFPGCTRAPRRNRSPRRRVRLPQRHAAVRVGIGVAARGALGARG
jgi:ketosteroid isomerase-like protein